MSHLEQIPFNNAESAVVRVISGAEICDLVDACEKLPQVECLVVNRFTPGLYSREFHMTAGTAIVSRVHKTEHQFFVSKGKVRVWNKLTGESEVITAPFHGITKPGAVRILLPLEDTVWTTFHPNPENEENVEYLVNKLTEDPREFFRTEREQQVLLGISG